MIRILACSLFLAAAAPAKDIVETAVDAGSFRKLAAALGAAGLVEPLRGDGPFTVFAPADAAFEALPEQELARLLSDEGRPDLRRLLTFHGVPGRITASALLTMGRAETLNGQPLRLRVEDGRLRVNEATVVTADIACRNGVIHVIDRVLLPEQRSIVEIAASNDSLSTLVAAVKAAGLAEALSGDGPFTVLAPTNEAFAKLPRDVREQLLRPENRGRLASILKYHVIPARATAAKAVTLRQAATLEGSPVSFTYRDGRVQAGRAGVVAADIPARNGVIHLIDHVLLPPVAPTGKDAVPAILELAIERGVPLFNDGQIAACAAIYEVAAAGVLALGEDAAPAPERTALRRALSGEMDARERAWALRRVFDRLLAEPEETAFEPVMEAPLPEGFPKPGPVGEVVVKRYPRYRMARAEGGMAAFGTLFRHIKRNDIAMTAPVEMTMEDGRSQKDMAFLYASPELGETGRDGRVEVVDVEPLTVLSVGLRGPVGADELAAAKRAVEARAEDAGWKRAGEWRLMGYNSPMIAADRRFYEFQLPVGR